MKKLAIVVPSDEETWEYELSLRCFQCDGEDGAVVTSEDPKVKLGGVDPIDVANAYWRSR